MSKSDEIKGMIDGLVLSCELAQKRAERAEISARNWENAYDKVAKERDFLEHLTTSSHAACKAKINSLERELAVRRSAEAERSRANRLACQLGSVDRSCPETADDALPPWARRSHARRIIWTEDDATIHTPGHVTIAMKMRELFGESGPGEPVSIHDAEDAVFKLYPSGHVLVFSYPGNSEIRKL